VAPAVVLAPLPDVPIAARAEERSAKNDQCDSNELHDRGDTRDSSAKLPQAALQNSDTVADPLPFGLQGLASQRLVQDLDRLLDAVLACEHVTEQKDEAGPAGVAFEKG